MGTSLRASVFGVALGAASAFATSGAWACGGFFCNQAQPVNQAAEGIIFADNGDGSITAVIQIKYQGPSQSFSWLLPISSVPRTDADIGVASDLAFQRLQAATNPSYVLNTQVEGTCKRSRASGSTNDSGVSIDPNVPGAPGGNGVNVEALGVVGAFEWTVISVDQSTAEPAAAAVAWLKDNGYDVPSGAPNLLGPYLEQGLHLLALRLTKGADSGSIRPIILTYQGTQPSIPVKLTAVAANDDMGVLTWVLGPSRAVPQNYLSLELNEARINWFNANANYNAVVTEAANDAGGQGFVTEFAGGSEALKDQIWTVSDDARWTAFKGSVFVSFADFFNRAYDQYGQWDGFWDATRVSVTLPTDGPSFEDFKVCPSCYAPQVHFSPASYLGELEKSVIEPVKRVQGLVDLHPQLTRLYTTLSADEMTLDPLFSFNPDLPSVSNLHSANRVIECSSEVFDFEAPWRIELPQGGTVRGTAQSVGSWPSALDTLPPNREIVQSGESGSGKVIEDNSAAIDTLLADYNLNHSGAPPRSTSGGCNVARDRNPLGALVALFAAAAVVMRRRRSPR